MWLVPEAQGREFLMPADGAERETEAVAAAVQLAERADGPLLQAVEREFQQAQ